MKLRGMARGHKVCICPRLRAGSVGVPDEPEASPGSEAVATCVTPRRFVQRYWTDTVRRVLDSRKAEQEDI